MIQLLKNPCLYVLWLCENDVIDKNYLVILTYSVESHNHHKHFTHHNILLMLQVNNTSQQLIDPIVPIS